jgi:hypothetical protein
MSNDLGILVLSCDKFYDLWRPYFSLFQEYYDGSSQVYLGSNTVTFEGDKITTIYSGEDTDWSTSCRNILRQIPNKYILLLLEDIFITSKIDSDKINQHLQYMKDNKAKHIHLAPTPKPDKWVLDQEFGVYEKGAPYRVNVVGYWDKEYLLSLLLDGESPWDFEIKGSYRTAYDDGFYCLQKPLFSSVHILEKGRWLPEAVNYNKKHNTSLEIEKRPILSSHTNFKSNLQEYYFNLMVKIPWKFRVKLMNVLRKLLISY